MDIEIQLIPYSEAGSPPQSHFTVERKLKQGLILKMGRQVIKEGQIQTKSNDHGLDIWFLSKVVSRHHAELWSKDGQLYIRDVGSSSGTFLNKMRLSPSGKGSRPYPLKDGDILQFGVDYKGKSEDIFKSIVLKVAFIDQWAQLRKKQGNPVKFQNALKTLLSATNPYASVGNQSQTEETNATTECCICISTIGPYQALFISPCSHAFHFKCVSSILSQSQMFPCPMCRQVANLTASVSMESMLEEEKIDIGSDSDVSVTVDEHGAAICTVHNLAAAGASFSSSQTSPSKDRPSTATVAQKYVSTSTSPIRPQSVEDVKHSKSFASKLTAFLQRKPSSSSLTTNSPTAPGPSAVVQDMHESTLHAMRDSTTAERMATFENPMITDEPFVIDVIQPTNNDGENDMIQ